MQCHDAASDSPAGRIHSACFFRRRRAEPHSGDPDRPMAANSEAVAIPARPSAAKAKVAPHGSPVFRASHAPWPAIVVEFVAKVCYRSRENVEI